MQWIELGQDKVPRAKFCEDIDQPCATSKWKGLWNLRIATNCCGKAFIQKRCYLLQSFFLWSYHIAVPGTLHYKQTVRTADWEVTFSLFQYGGQWTTLQQHLHPDFYRLAYPIGAGYSLSEGRLLIVMLFNNVAPPSATNASKSRYPPHVFLSCQQFHWWRQGDAVSGLDILWCSSSTSSWLHCVYHRARIRRLNFSKCIAITREVEIGNNIFASRISYFCSLLMRITESHTQAANKKGKKAKRKEHEKKAKYWHVLYIM